MDIRDAVAGKYTKQEIFDFVVEKLRAQGCASVNPFGRCLYRGPDGLKCAIGHMIPDELYRPGWDDYGDNASFLVVKRMGLAPNQILDFLDEAQRDLHDKLSGKGSYFPLRLEKMAENFAEKHNLTYTTPWSVSDGPTH